MTDLPAEVPEVVVAFRSELELDPDSELVSAVVVNGGRRLVLDPRRVRAPELSEVLRRAHGEERPIAFEAVDETISGVRFPLLSPVRDLDRGDPQITVVHLYASHAELRLGLGSDRADEWLQLLEESRSTGRVLAVTADDSAVIVDVRPVPEDLQTPSPPELTTDNGGWLAGLLRWLTTTCAFPFGLWRSIGPSAATSLFNTLAARVCPPVSPTAPCIPFNYPDDGCWGRAHEMCRLMTERGARPRKTWITGALRVETANNPNCEVRWGWHVAPTLCVRGSGFFGIFRIRAMVFDPALFDTPVTRSTWKARQNDAAANLEDLPWSIFHKWGSSTPGGMFSKLDPTFSGTNAVLSFYRTSLAGRSASVGPPPYPC